MANEELQISSIINKYFKSPWENLSPQEEKKVEELVYFPLKDPKTSGGLTKKGEQWAKKEGNLDLIKLSKEHKEKTRIEIHAALKTAWLYAKSFEKELDIEEKDSLLAGIALTSPLNRMQTVKKGGTMLAAGFVDKLGILYKRLIQNNQASQNKDYIDVIKKAASIHKNAEKRDKEQSEKILNI